MSETVVFVLASREDDLLCTFHFPSRPSCRPLMYMSFSAFKQVSSVTASMCTKTNNSQGTGMTGGKEVL